MNWGKLLVPVQLPRFGRGNELVRQRDVLTAASQVVRTSREIINPAAVPQSETWQDEVWSHFDSQGEFGFAIMWKANMISRVRLRAGRFEPGMDEPQLVNDGPAAELVNTFMGTPGGRAEAMSTMSVHLNLPGETWLLGEQDEGMTKWTVRSPDEIRTRGRTTEVVDDEQSGSNKQKWRALEGQDWMLVRIHRPHKRLHYLADSPGRRARPIIRELELVNRHITAQYLSRLASAGIVVFPQEIQFPTRPEFEDEPDPFVAEWIEIAREAIGNPGSASAVIPIPMRLPVEVIDKIQHIDFTVEIDENIISKRESAIRRLALQVDIPAEILTGLGDTNHWCKPGETTVLTLDGWRSHSQLAIGEMVLGLDHVTGRSVWTSVHDIYRADVVDQPMLTVYAGASRGPGFSFTATPDHRYPVIRDGERSIVRGHELQIGDVLTRGAVADAPETPTFTDEFVQLLAWYSADGTLTTRQHGMPGQIRIGKSWRRNPAATAELIRILTAVLGEPRERMPRGIGPAWRMEAQSRGMMLAVLNAAAREQIRAVVPNRDKAIPVDLVAKMTAGQRELFIQAWLASDGDKRVVADRSAGVIYQRNAARLDALERAAILSGHATRRWQKHHVGGYVDGVLHSLRIGAQPHAVVRRVESSFYTGMIWCPLTGTGTWLAREPDGWTEYTGNSAWQLEESAVKAHVLPDVELIAGGLTEGWLHPMLKAQGIDDAEDWAVWYDASEITLRPDRTDGAMKLYDRGELTGEALRRETGMDEEDAPSDEEFETIALRSLALQTQTGFAAIRALRGEDVPETVPDGGPTEEEPPTEDERPVDERRGPPSTRDEAPPPPDDEMRSDGLSREWLARQDTQRRAMHYAEVTIGGTWVRHPLVCSDYENACPYTHAVHNGTMPILPGQYGFYELSFSAHGGLAVGRRVYPDQRYALLPRDKGQLVALVGHVTGRPVRDVVKTL